MNGPPVPPVEEALPLEFLRPGQILEKARHPGLLLIPVSPACEWHSYHLPVGTDAIIVEEVARRLAVRLQAVHCRVLALGLDEVRDAAFKSSQGIDPQAHVWGMNYPGLPVASEYTTARAMRAVVEARLQAVKASGFRRAALLNHHGGRGQVPLLRAIASAWTAPGFRVDLLETKADPGFAPPPEAARCFQVGGHAGLAETLQLMAFRPDLVDLDALPDGPLQAARCGILHDGPEIPAAFNPHRATREWARLWGDHVLDRLAAILGDGAS